MTINGGTSMIQEKILAAVADYFSKRELTLIARLGKNLIVRIGQPPRKSADGSFQRKYGKGQPFVITIREDADRMAILHEFIHLVRVIDASRKGVTRTVYKTGRGFIADINQRSGGRSKQLLNAEESATSAEAVLRVDWPGKAPSYFDNLGRKDPNTGLPLYPYRQDNLINDRRILRRNMNGKVRSDGIPIKGTEAIDKMKNNYADTRISTRTEGDETAYRTSKKSRKW